MIRKLCAISAFLCIQCAFALADDQDPAATAFERASPSVALVSSYDRLCGGAVVSQDGLIVVPLVSVVPPCEFSVLAKTGAGGSPGKAMRFPEAQVVLVHPTIDVACIRLPGKRVFAPVTLSAKTPVRTGQTCYVVAPSGSPADDGLQCSVTPLTITLADWEFEGNHYIRLSAKSDDLPPGALLCDRSGSLVGMVVSLWSPDHDGAVAVPAKELAAGAMVEPRLRKPNPDKCALFLEGASLATPGLARSKEGLRAGVEVYSQALCADPGNIAALSGLGRMLLIAGGPAPAECFFRATVARDPANPTACRALAGLEMGRGKSQEAEKHLRRGMEAPRKPGNWPMDRAYCVLDFADLANSQKRVVETAYAVRWAAAEFGGGITERDRIDKLASGVLAQIPGPVLAALEGRDKGFSLEEMDRLAGSYGKVAASVAVSQTSAVSLTLAPDLAKFQAADATVALPPGGKEFPLHGRVVRAVAAYGGYLMVVQFHTGAVEVWDLRKGVMLKDWPGDNKPASPIACGGRWFVRYLPTERSLERIDLTDFKPSGKTVVRVPGEVLCMVMGAKRGDRVLVGTRGGEPAPLTVLDLGTGMPVATYEAVPFLCGDRKAYGVSCDDDLKVVMVWGKEQVNYGFQIFGVGIAKKQFYVNSDFGSLFFYAAKSTVIGGSGLQWDPLNQNKQYPPAEMSSCRVWPLAGSERMVRAGAADNKITVCAPDETDSVDVPVSDAWVKLLWATPPKSSDCALVASAPAERAVLFDSAGGKMLFVDLTAPAVKGAK